MLYLVQNHRLYLYMSISVDMSALTIGHKIVCCISQLAFNRRSRSREITKETKTKT